MKMRSKLPPKLKPRMPVRHVPRGDSLPTIRRMASVAFIDAGRGKTLPNRQEGRIASTGLSQAV